MTEQFRNKGIGNPKDKSFCVSHGDIKVIVQEKFGHPAGARR